MMMMIDSNDDACCSLMACVRHCEDAVNGLLCAMYTDKTLMVSLLTLDCDDNDIKSNDVG